MERKETTIMDTDAEGSGVSRNTLRKSDRLHHRSLSEGLFRDGKGFTEYPLRVVYRVMTREELEKNFRDSVPPHIGPVQMMVTVGKKRRRHAVDRVLMRRRIREAYRLNRAKFIERWTREHPGEYLFVALLYMSNENEDYARIERKMRAMFEKLWGRIG